jgi:hypothetical protein
MALLAISATIYIVTLGSGFNLPTWPVEGRWFFNPFAWQFIFVIGYALGGDGAPSRFVQRQRGLVRALGAIVVAIGLVCALNDWRPEPLSVPEPTAFFVVDKTFQTPLRLIHCLALVALFGGFFHLFLRWATLVVRFCSMLGRNALNVFCVGSLLSLAGKIARFQLGATWWVDTLVVIVGLLALVATAWVSEWRERLKA